MKVKKVTKQVKPVKPAKLDYTLGLAPLDAADMPLVRTWRNDYRIWRWMRASDFSSAEQQSDWYERQSQSSSERYYLVTIHDVKTPEQLVKIGLCGFTGIDHFNRRAEFSLYIAPQYHGHGFGKQALSLLLLHGFSNLGFAQIYGEVLEGNPALEVFKKAGFKEDGRRRGFYFRDGELRDAHLISILRAEWNH